MSHIVGKVYEVTKENMNKIIEEFDERNEQYAEALALLRECREVLAEGDQYNKAALKEKLDKFLGQD